MKAMNSCWSQGFSRFDGLWCSRRATRTDRLKPLLQQPRAAIVPLILGGEVEAVRASEAMLEAGFLIPAIRFPTVARGTARLRLTLSAAHEAAQIESLVACLHGCVPQLFAAAHPATQNERQ
jgi:7-keto-8-aminopelargonate synthetase-like enzyme